MKFGDLPKELGTIRVECDEMMFYQYLPIKLPGTNILKYEDRLKCFSSLLEKIQLAFISEYGIDEYSKSYVYLTAKHMYQPPQTSFNRMGYHTDGFLTLDINYIWSNVFPTIFNKGEFNLTLNDEISMKEMEDQALVENEITYPNDTLLRLNQYNVHRVGDNNVGGMRIFIKVSFSQDKYDLKGNSHNYNIDYNWEMKERKLERNIPQTNL